MKKDDLPPTVLLISPDDAIILRQGAISVIFSSFAFVVILLKSVYVALMYEIDHLSFMPNLICMLILSLIFFETKLSVRDFLRDIAIRQLLFSRDKNDT